MALNTFKCNHLTLRPLRFKRLSFNDLFLVLFVW